MSTTWTTASLSTVCGTCRCGGLRRLRPGDDGPFQPTERITEIGAVIFRDGQPCERFQTFVNPHRRLSQKIVDLTGITDAMLQRRAGDRAGAAGISAVLR